MLALAQANLDVAEYTPMEVKQAITGYGGAEKLQIQMMVQAILNLEVLPKPDDAADALAVAVCHVQSYRMRALLDSTE
jgi:crossover junction endodeoxyribonuclease RuvC